MMLKRNSVLFLILLYSFGVFSQIVSTPYQSKSIIDSTAIKRWITLGYGQSGQLVSNDGFYFCYIMLNRPIGGQTAVLQSLRDSSKMEFVGGTPIFFTSDSKELVLTLNDTLIRYNLLSKKIIKLGGLENIKHVGESFGNWVAFQDHFQRLSVLNCINSKLVSFSRATDYCFDNTGRRLLISVTEARNTDTVVTLKLFNLANGLIKDIWSDNKVSNVLRGSSFSVGGSSVCFMVQRLNHQSVENEIWAFEESMAYAEKKADDNSLGIKSGLKIADALPKLSPNGRFVFFHLQDKQNPVKMKDHVNVDIWNYRDQVIQSSQLLDPSPKLYASVIGLHRKTVVQLESDSIKLKTYSDMTRGDYVVAMTDVGDQFWLDSYSKSNTIKYFLVSMIDGSKTDLELCGNNEFYFSPSGKYLIYFNSRGGNNYYYSYNLSTHRAMNICKNVPPTAFGDENILYEYGGSADDVRAPGGIAGWLKQDKGVLVYDNNDIWKLDYSTGSPPLCITNNFGKKNKIKFWLLYASDKNTGQESLLPQSESGLLAAFDTRNYFNGFYRTSLRKISNPHYLSMGPWTVFVNNGYLLPSNQTIYDLGIEPLKAKSADIWIVKRHTSTDAPNYYYTKNFKEFVRITDVQPHTEYNWLETERVDFKQLDGIMSSGVLYKPENFDANKKYPVIIHYYQQLSQRLYQYLPARFAASVINIPWFVSRGYLVLTPDIHFTKGKLGLSAYNSIVGAADWLCKQPYIDSKKIGINGHSLGGFKTNYLITHTSRFAAALSGAGVSNQIEGALGIGGYENASRLAVTERRFGANFYGNIDLYLENSPILKADLVTTPLLLFHCKSDYAVSWQHSVEFFSALRRLQKPVWFLQYDEGHHVLELERDKIDYTIRITQFFDHYLKGCNMPNWMSKGIPAFMKGAYLGYESEATSQ